MPTKYFHTTLTQFLTALKKALDSDPTVTNFWTEIELITIIQEALLTFGAISGFWKRQILVNTKEEIRLYDIFTDNATVESIAPTLTYGDILNWINIDLIESISEASPISDLFTLEELLSAIDSKYNLFQLETSLINSKTILNVEAQNNLVKLPDEVLDLVRLKFTYENDGTNYEVILRKDDEESIAQYDSDAITENDIPRYYSTVFGSPNEVFLYPIPNVSGTLEVIYIGSRNLSEELTVNTKVNLPNNLAVYLKYHVEEDIFNKDGPLNDPGRAAYCGKRWKEGITIGKQYTSALVVRANNLPIFSDSITKTDMYTDLLSATSDAPSTIGLAGFNIFEIDTLPNTDVNTISLFCIDNASLPVLPDDRIDVELGYIDSLMNYCIHLCQFKTGSYGLATTNNYMEEFIKIALAHNQRLQDKGVNYETLIGKTKLEEKTYPRIAQMSAQ